MRSKKAEVLETALGQAKEQADGLREQAAGLSERIAPAVADAKVKASELAQAVATKVDEVLPDDYTPDAVKEASSRSGGTLKKLFVLLGLGAVGAFVAKKVRGGGQEEWQAASASPAPAPRPAHDAAGGGTPDEAAADAAEGAHTPTTPDAPVSEVAVDDPDKGGEKA